MGCIWILTFDNSTTFLVVSVMSQAIIVEVSRGNVSWTCSAILLAQFLQIENGYGITCVM